MNVERILQVASVVEKGHHKFNGIHAFLYMPSWMIRERDFFDRESFTAGLPLNREDLEGQGHACNTAACMAGFACLVLDYEATQKMYPTSIEDRARELLELTYEEAQLLFSSNTNRNITGPEAARVMRHFAETGEVDWNVAYEMMTD